MYTILCNLKHALIVTVDYDTFDFHGVVMEKGKYPVRYSFFSPSYVVRGFQVMSVGFYKTRVQYCFTFNG